MTAPTDPALNTRFEAAVVRSRQLSERPDNMTLLQLYALFKQASEGDAADSEKPGAMDFVGMAKFNARVALRGTTSAEAMQKYIDLVDSLA